MDQGLAAVLGAAVGGLAATFAALWAGRQSRWQTKAQMRGQHIQWRRESRREAYTAFALAADDLRVRMNAFSHQIAGSSLNSDSLVEYLRDIHNCSASLFRAKIIVSLEGPSAATEVAEKVEDAHDSYLRKLKILISLDPNGEEFDNVAQETSRCAYEAGRAAGYFVGNAYGWLNKYEDGEVAYRIMRRRAFRRRTTEHSGTGN